MQLNIENTPQTEEQSQIEQHKVVILGSGPAGWSAALYAARAEMSPVVITGMELGGQVALTYTVENYPGFPEGVGGIQLSELFQKQAEKFGATTVFDRASKVDLTSRPFRVETDSGSVYQADSLIISTGASPNHLNVPGETRLTGKGVSYCGTCDGYFFKEKHIVVVGGGDSALEEAIFLTRFAASVTIIHRRDTLRAGAILQTRAEANPKINYIWNTIVTEIAGDQSVAGVHLQNTQTGETSFMPTQGVFIFIGHTPNTQMFTDQLEMIEGGYIKVNQRAHTSVEGVFAAGEAADATFKQVVTSAGMGAAAAMEAVRFLEENG